MFSSNRHTFHHYYKFLQLQANGKREQLSNIMQQYLEINGSRENYQKQRIKRSEFTTLLFQKDLIENIFDSVVHSQEQDLTMHIVKLLRLVLATQEPGQITDERFLSLCKDVVGKVHVEDQPNHPLHRIIAHHIRSTSRPNSYMLIRYSDVDLAEEHLTWKREIELPGSGEKQINTYLYNLSPIECWSIENNKTYKQVFYINKNSSSLTNGEMISGQCCWCLLKQEISGTQIISYYELIELPYSAEVWNPIYFDRGLNILDTIFGQEKCTITGRIKALRKEGRFKHSLLTNYELEELVLINNL